MWNRCSAALTPIQDQNCGWGGGVLDRTHETTDYHQLAVDELTQTNRSMLKLLSLDHGNLLLHPELLVLVSLSIFILKNYTSLFFLKFRSLAFAKFRATAAHGRTELAVRIQIVCFS